MKKISLIILLPLLLLAGCSKSNDVGANSTSVTLSAAGTLASSLGSKLKTTTMLIVKGIIDARDFVVIRDSMPALKVLDISGTTIADYSGTLGTAGAKNMDYPANTVPPFAFHNATTNVDETLLSSIILPASATAIGDSALMNCSGLAAISIPLTATSLGAGAFSGCSGLTSISIPLSVASIGSYAFNGCTAINTIYTYATTPIGLQRSISVFGGINSSTCILYVPTGMKSTYKTAIGWSIFTNIVEFGGGAI